MQDFFDEIGVKIPEIYLPKKWTDLSKWSVVACDQYTSEPEYWKEVNDIVGENPSTLNITLPEIYLEDSDVEERIKKINKNMEKMLEEDIFDEYKDTCIYIERTQNDGKVREGFIVCHFCLVPS